MQRLSSIERVILAHVFASMLILPSFGQQTVSSNSLTQQASFGVRASELGAGGWNSTSLDAKKGQWVLVENKPLGQMLNQNNKPGTLFFKPKDESNPSCSISISPSAKPNQTQRTSFRVTADGRIMYATKGTFAVEVKLTLSDTQAVSALAAGEINSGSANNTPSVSATIPCPQCHGSGKYTAFTTKIPGSNRQRMSHFVKCPTCNGSGRATQQAVDVYWKSVEWGNRNVLNTPGNN